MKYNNAVSVLFQFHFSFVSARNKTETNSQ